MRKKKRAKDLRVKISISMAPQLIKRLDAVARIQNRNRSNMVSEYVRRGIEE